MSFTEHNQNQDGESMEKTEFLRRNPYWLSKERISRVEELFSTMTVEEKLGQVFCSEIRAGDEKTLKEITETYHMGAVMCLPAPAAELKKLSRELQNRSRIPVLVGGNLEEGADAARGATNIANNLQIAATGNAYYAMRMGRVTAKEGTAAGFNWAFAPVIDIAMNWRNPVIATRAFGSDAGFVAEAGRNFVVGMQSGGMAAAIKHFPGDGVDERDQHFAPSVNSLSCEEWDRTFGNAYRECIDAGALTVMVGHILQPAWSKRINPGLTDDKILPGSTSPELLQGLLRGHLGFNGMISTDATTMSGFDQLLPRSEAIPAAISAGCDLLLFTKDTAEDHAYLKAGYEKGVVTGERLDDAVLHILGVKAALGLLDKVPEDRADTAEDPADMIGLPEYKALAKSCADNAVTLVKDIDGLLPVSPEKHRRVYLVTFAEARGAGNTPESMADMLKDKLEARGFEVTAACMQAEPDLRGSHEALRAKYDLVIYAANMHSVSNKAVTRIDWGNSMGKDAPTFLQDIPTMLISFGNPYHLVDIPRVHTYINAYKFKDSVIDAVLDRITGLAGFAGRNPVDPFCGFWDTRL